MLRVGLAFVALPSAILPLGCASDRDGTRNQTKGKPEESRGTEKQNTEGNSMKIQYLEIVTPNVDAVCETAQHSRNCILSCQETIHRNNLLSRSSGSDE